MRAGVLVSLSALLATGCIFDGDLKHRNATVPDQLEDGWLVATPESVGIDPRALAAVHDELLREDRYVGALGLLVIKDDKLVWETYLRTPADRDHYHHLGARRRRHVTVVRDGAERGGSAHPHDRRAVSEVSGLPVKGAITVGDLLTMRWGSFDATSSRSRCGSINRRIVTPCSKPMYEQALGSTTVTSIRRSSATRSRSWMDEPRRALPPPRCSHRC
jgi:hypothetical protein